VTNNTPKKTRNQIVKLRIIRAFGVCLHSDKLFHFKRRTTYSEISELGLKFNSKFWVFTCVLTGKEMVKCLSLKFSLGLNPWYSFDGKKRCMVWEFRGPVKYSIILERLSFGRPK